LQRSALNGEQHSPFLDGGSDVLVAEDVIYAARCRKEPSRAFQRFRMLTKSSRRIGNGFFQGFACRKASFDIWKPNAERAVGLFFNDRHVLCRHRE
jgi:hypothetical protein